MQLRGVRQAQGGASVQIPVHTGGMVRTGVVGGNGVKSGIGLVIGVIYFRRILFFPFRILPYQRDSARSTSMIALIVERYLPSKHDREISST